MSSPNVGLSQLPRNLGKALVVDDDPAVRMLYAEVLEAMGFQVETAPDGLKAVDRVQAVAHNLIISDVRMPGMSGVEFFLKAEQLRPGTADRFIFTTGLLDSLNTHEYMIVTDKPCIMKPVQIEKIQKAALEVLRRIGARL